MKQEINDWLLRLIRIDCCGNSVAFHVCLYDMSRSQVMKLAEDYGKEFAVVRVFKFEDLF